MKTYFCVCGQRLFFENVGCVNCRRELGFLPDRTSLTSLDPDTNGVYIATAREAKGRRYKKCQNYQQGLVCNWMVPIDSKEVFCTSCRLDEIIPDMSVAKNRLLWQAIETAKRRLVYTLLKLELPLKNRGDDPKQGLAFRLLGDAPNQVVLTGHDEGIITLNIAEADDAEREKRRLSMKEPYRTLLGHFRHEIGHYYWDRLVRDSGYLQPFRALFGDESASYDQALKNYYATGAPVNWQDSYISMYATAHPWEDWAESWAHFMHIQDTLEVALDFGLIEKRVSLDEELHGTWLGPRQKTFEEKIAAWSELTIALNSINRSMGLNDIYPFVLSTPVVQKLHFISDVIAGHDVTTHAPAQGQTPEPAGPSGTPASTIDSKLAPAVANVP
jgi:hypothetical protein